MRLSQVELFETNDPESVTHAGVVTMAIVTGVSLAVTVACAANPKACFGSCPTFYASDGSGEVLQAEGFSASVARSLEATDVDAMWTARPRTRIFDLLMKNEALETHLVDSVRVLAVPRPVGGRVLRAGDAFFPATRLEPPTSCLAEHGDCLAEVADTDGREYASLADADDLATKETIELEFPRPRGRAGLVIAAKNSLLNTFLFYQLLAYMGHSAGDWYVRLDHGGGGTLEVAEAFKNLLGDIEVAIRGRDGAFHRVGSFSEVGPIAREVQLVTLPAELSDPKSKGPLVVRVTMTKGNWKLDYLGLAEIGSPMEPRYIEPEVVLRRGQSDPEALERLQAPGVHLVTFPGDAYTLRFELPAGEQELFLESRGYYYEWIRESWLREEDSLELLRVMTDPANALRRLAPAYKHIEGDMDRIFWQSRVGQR